MKKMPYFLRDIQQIQYKDFLLQKDTKSLISDMWAGDVVILKDVFDPEKLYNLTHKIYEYSLTHPSTKDIKIIDGCPNYNQTSSTNLDPSTGYSILSKIFYFFRWNKDELGVFSLVDDAWDSIKKFWGIPPDLYKKNIPSNYVIERAQILFYPLNHGFLSSHSDGQTKQEIVIGVPLSNIGEDYDEGGLYFLKDEKTKLYIDSLAPRGSIVTWVGSVLHGIATPTIQDNTELNWEQPHGRWMMLLLIVESHESKNRKTSKSMEQILDTL